MTFGRVALAGFVGGLAAAVIALAWKSSQETGKSVQASIVDVPSEAQKLAADARARAIEAANAGWQAFKDKEAELAQAVKEKEAQLAQAVKEKEAQIAQAVKEKEAEFLKRIPGRGGDDTSMVEEAVIEEAATEEAAEQA